MFNITHLKLSWSVSKGRDTDGYNICRLDDNNTGKRYKCNGGGYDMVGTCFGQWLADVYQEQLQAAGKVVTDLYGAKVYNSGAPNYDTRVSLDGACGFESMLKIAEAIGLEVEREYVKKGRNRGQTIGYYVQMKDKV